MTKFKDVAHLYIGCDVSWELDLNKDLYREIPVTFKSCAVICLSTFEKEIKPGSPKSFAVHIFNSNGIDYKSPPLESVKPHLFRLEDITDDVLKQLFNVCYTHVYDQDPPDLDFNFDRNDRFPVVRTSEDVSDTLWEYVLTLTQNGCLFITNGFSLKTPDFQITRILLENYYDLFNFIDSGEAIDKKATIQKTRIL